MAIQVAPELKIAPISLELWHGMIDAGLLEGARVELIDGMMVEMSPKSPEHDFVIQVLTRVLASSALDAGMDVRVQSALTIGETEPEPDLAVVARDDAARTAHPSTAELVIEVAFSSHAIDRGRKAALYAEAGVPEYWIVDVPGRAIEVLTEPGADGYAHTAHHGPAATLAPAALPAASVAVGELLPPPAPQ